MADYLGLGMPVDGGSMNPGQSLFSPQGNLQSLDQAYFYYMDQNRDKGAFDAGSSARQGLKDAWRTMTPEQQMSYYNPTGQYANMGMETTGMGGGGMMAPTQPGMMAPPTPSWVNETTKIANPLSAIPMGEQYNTIAGPLPGQPQTTPDQQLNTPSFEQLAQPNPALTPTDYAMPAPPPSVTPVPVTQPTPGTSNLIQQIQAPVAGAPTTQLPVTQPTPGATNLIQQIQAPTTPRSVAQPNRATQQFAQQFRPQPAAQPRPQPVAQPRPSPVKTGLQSFASVVSPGAAPVAQAQPAMRPAPVAKPQPAMRPAPVLQPKLAPQPAMRPAPARPGLQVFPSVVSPRPMATSVSRVNPPLLPSRPMGRR